MRKPNSLELHLTSRDHVHASLRRHDGYGQSVGPNSKKTKVLVETLTNNNRHSTRETMTLNKKERSRQLHIAKIISANAHLAHLQSHTSQCTTQVLQKIAILPALLEKRRINITFKLN